MVAHAGCALAFPSLGRWSRTAETVESALILPEVPNLREVAFSGGIV